MPSDIDNSSNLSEKKTRRKGPGRPEGASIVRDEILDAAEQLFANLGYAGTTMREVADAAKVAQASINYYFGSKFGLFEAVFLRRATAISEDRMLALEQVLADSDLPDVRKIVEAFLLPTAVLRNTEQGRCFLRLQARLHTEPPEISYVLRDKAYGESTQKYVEALQRAIPGISALDAHWRITLMIGSYLYAFSDTHRMEERLPGIFNKDDHQSLIDQVCRFVVGGIKDAPSNQESEAK